MKAVRTALWGIAAVILLMTAAGFLSRAGFPFELVTHVRPQLAALALLVGIASFVFRAPRAGGALLAATLANGWTTFAPLAGPAPGLNPGEEPEFTVVWANLAANSVAMATVSALADSVGADAVAITEEPHGDPDYEDLFPELTCLDRPPPGYTFKVVTLHRPPCREGGPVEGSPMPGASRVIPSDEPGVPHVYAVHPGRPFDQARLRRREEVVRTTAYTAQETTPALFIGDFSATPWSPIMADVKRFDHLRVDCGHPWRATWRSKSWLGGLPIDLAYVSQGVRARCSLGPEMGSDHFAVIVRMAGVAP
ncbi:MAG: endonuclease/exonuclease/phosphatase family protein [Caulobacterales bacterium]|nr:endonuclease/exonuclease/phosphatase family protein [Caulobacterales bacterium]